MHEIVKSEYSKFGFSQSVLETISKMVTDEAGADATDEVIKEKLQNYEPLAKAFQSEIDARVSKAKTSTQTKTTSTEQVEPKNEQGEDTPAWAKVLLQKVEALENEKLVSNFNTQAEERLKGIKMSDAEVKAVMFGREFKTNEEVENFITQQSEIFKEVLSTRVEEQLGGGNPPAQSQGATDLESFKKDLEEFNKIK